LPHELREGKGEHLQTFTQEASWLRKPSAQFLPVVASGEVRNAEGLRGLDMTSGASLRGKWNCGKGALRAAVADST
jgi:hypothetical protein